MIIKKRGIKIGEVKLIEVTENRARNKVMIPVYVEFFVEKNFGFTQNPIHLLISNGYVAQISKPNFITGNAEIELVQSNDQGQRKQIMFHGYPIFPTRDKIEKYTTFDDSIKSAKMTFEAIRKFVDSQEIKDLIKSTQEMTTHVERLAINIEGSLPRSLIYFNQRMKQISDAASSTQNLTDYLSRNPESLIRGKR